MSEIIKYKIFERYIKEQYKINIDILDLKRYESNFISKLFNPNIKKKKLFIKPKIKSKPLKKKKKLLIKKMSTYKKFIEVCQEYEIEYFRYKNKYNWEGPCVKTNEIEGITLDMLESIFEFDILKQQVAFSYLVHPKIFEDPNSIEYPNENKERDVIDVEEWIYNDINYNVDPYTGNLYDDEGELIGRRKVKNGKYFVELFEE